MYFLEIISILRLYYSDIQSVHDLFLSFAKSGQPSIVSVLKPLYILLHFYFLFCSHHNWVNIVFQFAFYYPTPLSHTIHFLANAQVFSHYFSLKISQYNKFS